MILMKETKLSPSFIYICCHYIVDYIIHMRERERERDGERDYKFIIQGTGVYKPKVLIDLKEQ